MGQHYLIVNRTKGEFLHPHKFGDGLKLLEFGDSAGGVMLGLAILLTDGNNRGGGDLRSDSPVIGSWSGDSIVIAGDYADPGKWLGAEEVEGYIVEHDDEAQDFLRRYPDQPFPVTLFAYTEARYRDISDDVIAVLCDDAYIRNELKERLAKRRTGWAGGLPPALEERIFGRPAHKS